MSELQIVTRALLLTPGLAEDADNLRHGVLLEITYPHLRQVSCEQCRDWWIDPLDPADPLARDEEGKPIRRPNRNDVLCQTPRGCPKGHFSNPIVLNDKNRQAWLHFQECDATGVFPDDPMVAHNASIIRDVLKERDRRARLHGVGRSH